MLIPNISAETEYEEVTCKMDCVVLIMLIQGFIREVIQKYTGKAAQRKSQNVKSKEEVYQVTGGRKLEQTRDRND